jgi:transposase
MECATSNIISPASIIQKQEEHITVLEETNKELAQTILDLQFHLEASQSEITELKLKITELEGRLGLNSGNSSFPPSRNIVDPPPKPKSLRKRSGWKAGGQKGRKGVTRTLSDTPDKVEDLTVETCSCGCSLSETEVESIERRQVVDIVFSPLETTEYRAERKKCPECSRIVSAPFPDGVENPVNFGINIKVLVLYLRIVLFTPYKKMEQLLNDFYGVEISPATAEKWISAASKSLDVYDKEVRRRILASPILHADETGCRVLGKRWWLHCLSTSKLTYYWVHQNRGVKAMDAMGILPYYMGILVHDFWASYTKYKCYHAYCNAHLIRDLQGIYDVFKQEWAKDLRDLLEKMHQYTFGGKSEDESENMNFKMWNLKFWELIEEYERLVRQGKLVNPPPPKKEGEKGKNKNTKGWNLASRMEEHIYEVLGFFITGGQIPFTNNQAEQDIRMMKVQQKISGTFRTKQGAICFARLRGYISTMRKQDQSILEAVQALARGKPILLSELEANKMVECCS